MVAVSGMLAQLLLQVAVMAATAACASSAGSDVHAVQQRIVWATISTQTGKSPKFACDHDHVLVYKPGAASAAKLFEGGGLCWLHGATAAGEYVVQPTGGAETLMVVKAIDLNRPVTNLGGATIFTEGWGSQLLQDGDDHADVWKVDSGCGTVPAQADGRLVLSPECGLTSVPHEVRTFNFFRHPLTLTVADVRVSLGSLVRIALAVPSSAAVNSTGWPSVKHYLQPLRGNDARGAAGGSDAGASSVAASLAVTVSSREVQLLRRRTLGGQTELLGSAKLPAGCGNATVQLFAGATFTVSTDKNSAGSPAPPLRTRLQVFCGAAATPAANISSDLGLGFLDENGFGETVGESVLEISTLNDSSSIRAATVASGAAVGRIWITNDLDSTFSPAVLAPISDRVGTVNWDHGELGAAFFGRFPHGADDGILDVTLPPFSADNTGAADATLALQSAIDFARHNYLSVWLPAGEYRVTQSLRALQHPRQSANGFAGLNLTANFCFNRYTSWAIRGEVLRSDADNPPPPSGGRTPGSRPGRATLVLPPHTPAFALVGGSATTPLAVLNVSSVNSHFELEPNVLMNTIVQSIDIVVGPGNPAAVGVRMRGAQGSGLEDIGVFAASDAFAGVSGVSGSGGAHINLTVVGARFGIDARDTQPSSSLANVRLINQSCAALIHQGLETLTIAGLFVSVDGEEAEPGGAAIITGSPYGSKSAKGPPSPTTLPGLPVTGNCAPLLSPATNVGLSSHKYIMGTLSIVDAGFECTGAGCASLTAVAGNRNTYLRRATVSGFNTIASAHAPGNASEAVLYRLRSPSAASTVHELSIAIPTRPGTINGTAFIDGKSVPATIAPVVNVTALSAAGLASHSFDQVCDRLGWGDNLLFPSHASAGALIVTDFGARGDGRHDDSVSIQRCVDAAAGAGVPVFIPRGVFRTSVSIVVPRGVQIVGLGRHLTMLITGDTGFRGSALEDSRQFDRHSVVGDAPPILLYSNSPAAMVPTSPVETVVFGISLVVAAYNVHTNASMLVFRASAAKAGGFNVYRQMWSARLNICGQYWGGECSRRFFAQKPYHNAYTRIEGEETTLRMFVYFQEDSQNSVGLTSQSPFYRKLLIEGTRRPIDIVQLNGEHSHTSAYTEIVNTTGISVLGCKSERDGPVIFLRASRRFASYGHGKHPQFATSLVRASADSNGS